MIIVAQIIGIHGKENSDSKKEEKAKKSKGDKRGKYLKKQLRDNHQFIYG